MCSQAVISSSQALTSDCRAEDMNVIIPSTNTVACWDKGEECGGSTASPSCGSHFQHRSVVTVSYLSSSRSSTMASFVTFVGGSFPSTYVIE